MSAMQAVKIEINRLMPSGLSSKDIPALVKKGKMPQTAQHLVSADCDFRSVSPWREALNEIKGNSSLWVYSLLD